MKLHRSFLKSHYQRQSSFVKLETILEDESQEFNSLSKAFLSFPLLFFGLLYILLWRRLV